MYGQIVLLCQIFLCVSGFSQTDATPSPYSYYLTKCIESRSKGQFDSSSYFLDLARVNGLPKDSFFLEYANIYLEKGLLDTALAFNYSIHAIHGESIYKSKFEQRYLIYSILGLHNEASKALDSIGAHVEGVQGKTFNIYPPRITVATGGFFNKNNTLAFNYDFGKRIDEISEGFGATLFSGIRWDLPYPGNRLITIGINYTNDKSSDLKKFYTDSLSHTWNTSLQINDIKSLSSSYTFTRAISSSGTFSSAHALSLSYFLPNSDYSRYSGITTGIKLVNSDLNSDYQLYSLFGFHERPWFTKSSATFSLLAYYLRMKNTVQYETVHIIQFDGNMTSPTFLTLANTPISNTHFLSSSLIRTAYRDTVIKTFEVPNSQINISPSMDNTYPLFSGIKLRTSLEYSFQYSIGTFHYKNSHVSNDSIARNSSTGEMYQAPDPNERHASILDEPYVETSSKIDNSISFGLILERTIWKIGTITAGYQAEQSFSTLKKSAPIDIADWAWQLSLALTIQLPLKK